MRFAITEIIIIFVFLLVLAIPVASAVWVFTDASRRANRNAGLWTVGALFLWFPALLIYLIVRPDFRKG